MVRTGHCTLHSVGVGRYMEMTVLVFFKFGGEQDGLLPFWTGLSKDIFSYCVLCELSKFKRS